MNNSNSQENNIFYIPLNKTQIIESSAGTGKTFTIVLLFLRLLIGLGNSSKTQKKFSIQEILIVTFTNEAKLELLARITQYITKLKIACIKKTSHDKNILIFIKKIKNLKDTITLLNSAEKNINKASIYTIHGFCKKMLIFYQYNYCFKKKDQLIVDNFELYLKSTIIFWKKYCYYLSFNIIKIIFKTWDTPHKLLKFIYPILKVYPKKNYKNLYKKDDIEKHHNKILLRISYFKKRWILKKNDIFDYLKKTKIRKQVYNNKNIYKWTVVIDKWSDSKTIDYYIPNELNYFKIKKIEKSTQLKNQKIPHILKEIDFFLEQEYSIKNLFILYSIQEISKIIHKEKKKFSLYEFNDLIHLFKFYLNAYPHILLSIRKKFPIAFIDEFQDTDLDQYEIFKKIYFFEKNISLIIIGDPKQSIYKFRGANINVYFQAKYELPSFYKLNTNFRSSTDMVNGINFLFSRIKNPFIFEQIQFDTSLSNTKNENMNFKINNSIQPAINMLITPENIQGEQNKMEWLAEQFASIIFNWLYTKKMNCEINLINKKYILSAKDIVILVRNQQEGNLIQQKLEKLSIPNIYLSDKKSIFKTMEAKEIFIILDFILNMSCENKFQKALSTKLLNKNIYQIENLILNKNKKSIFIEKFINYNLIWKKFGIYILLQTIIKDFSLIYQQLMDEHQKKYAENILHLGELLQEKSFYIRNKNLLINWLSKKIYHDNITVIPKQELIRQNKDFNNLIRIVNIHSSKGLEFPITLIPFNINNKEKKFNTFIVNYNKKKNFFNSLKKNLEIKNYKKIELSEDLRLLYVALTRAMLHTIIGIKISNNKKKSSFTNLHNNALGYLIQKGKKTDIEEFYNEIAMIKKEKYFNLIFSKKIDNSYILKKKDFYQNSYEQLCLKHYKNNWSFTSYSKIKNETNNILTYQNIKNNNDFILNNQNKKNENDYSQTQFPIGLRTGIFFHDILQKIDFHKPVDEVFISNKLSEYNFKLELLPKLLPWINNIFYTNLGIKDLYLSNLKENTYIKELEFFLPIKKKLSYINFYNVIKNYDNLSKLAPPIKFKDIIGMIRGSIDLIFIWKKKYYILDYKSDSLGKKNNSYSQSVIVNNIIKNKYHLQYQIYSLVLHRYLKHRIKNYNFSKHFGGIIYFFIRAVYKKSNNNGIFKTTTNYNTIKKLDQLFNKNNNI